MTEIMVTMITNKNIPLFQTVQTVWSRALIYGTWHNPVVYNFDVIFQGKMTCQVCGKWFHSRQQVAQHMLVHTDERKYKCKFCDRAFKQPSHLDQHHRIHTGKESWPQNGNNCRNLDDLILIQYGRADRFQIIWP